MPPSHRARGPIFQSRQPRRPPIGPKGRGRVQCQPRPELPLLAVEAATGPNQPGEQRHPAAKGHPGRPQKQGPVHLRIDP